MATNAFNTGKDCSLVITHPLAPGGELVLPLITDFDAKPSWHDIKSNTIDGYTRTAHIPESVMLTFSVDRSDPTVDTFCSALWQAYRTTGRIPDGIVTQYVNEINLSTSTTTFIGVAFKPEDLGTYKKESTVPQKITGTAMDYKRI